MEFIPGKLYKTNWNVDGWVRLWKTARLASEDWTSHGLPGQTIVMLAAVDNRRGIPAYQVIHGDVVGWFSTVINPSLIPAEEES